jgi:hypothetical protein
MALRDESQSIRQKGPGRAPSPSQTLRIGWDAALPAFTFLFMLLPSLSIFFAASKPREEFFNNILGFSHQGPAQRL